MVPQIPWPVANFLLVLLKCLFLTKRPLTINLKLWPPPLNTSDDPPLLYFQPLENGMMFLFPPQKPHVKTQV